MRYRYRDQNGYERWLCDHGWDTFSIPKCAECEKFCRENAVLRGAKPAEPHEGKDMSEPYRAKAEQGVFESEASAIAAKDKIAEAKIRRRVIRAFSYLLCSSIVCSIIVGTSLAYDARYNANWAGIYMVLASIVMIAGITQFCATFFSWWEPL